MDTLKIKAFLLIEKYKNFSIVADKFSYTPSAISHMADSLENELGVKLFNRTKKGVELTDAGLKLYDKFSAVLKAEEDLLGEAATLSEHNTLKIGAYSSIAHHFLPDILQSFKESCPGVKTTIVIDDRMNNWIEQGIADIVLADKLIDTKQQHPLLEDEFVAVVPENEFVSQSEITVEELYNCVFIKSNEANLDSYLDYSKFKEVMEVKSIENNSLIYMVKAKLGISILPKMSIKELPDGVKALKLTPKISRTICVMYDTKRPSWACMQFLKHLKKQIQ